MSSKKPKVIVVMPAYHAEKTIEKTFAEVPKGLVNEIILVDDAGGDKTIAIAKKLGITVYQHSHNLGYGGNQKTCYWEALKRNPDVVVMLHPDYQYNGSKIKGLVDPILNGDYDMMFGSRIKSRGMALTGGMPKSKYFSNRLFTLFANILLGENLSEYLSGLRAYSRKCLESVPYQRFSDDFAFDQQFTVSAIAKNLRIGEIPIPTRYHVEQHTLPLISFRGVKFVVESYWIIFLYLLRKANVYKSKIFD
ncbi:MAG: Glycosyl transferase, group 2 family protein [Microgenomates group bacterium GW2011_GWA1_48_10]|nr:MAG: Glycosyl transferase, group 2 family protein [Microgenomates group bacterium GW2011_GWA1_48_10]